LKLIIGNRGIKLISTVLFTFSLSLAGLSSCKSSGNDKNSTGDKKMAKINKNFIFAKPKDAVTLDPADVTDGESSGVTQNIFETLVRYKEEGTDVEPALAESWKTSEDGLTWTFKLRKNIKFHDGSDFNASAVKFNYDRQMDPKNAYRNNGKFEYWNLFFSNVEEIKENEPYSISLRLKEKDPTFLSNMALFTMGIASPEAIKKFGKDTFKNPVGTGPFKFASWVQNEKIHLKANENYWDKKPIIENLIFKPVADNSVRLLELEKGDIHGMDGINPDDVQKIKNNKNLRLFTQPGMNVGYLAMNNEKPPLDNQKVRLAINYAINKNGMVKAFFADGMIGMTAKNPIPPTMWSYNDKIKDHDYNKEMAKKLLKESGAKLDKSIELWAMPVARPYMPQPQRIAESIQADLKEVGLDTKIVSFEWGTYLDKVAKGDHEMCLLGWIGDNGDPDNFMYTLLSSNNTKKGSASNYAFYKSAEMDKYLNEGKKTIDQQKRTDSYLKAQEVFNKDVPWVPLFHSTQTVAFRAGIDGYKLHPTGAKIFKNIKITSIN